MFFFKQKTAYEMRISDWSSDVCSSDLGLSPRGQPRQHSHIARRAGSPLPQNGCRPGIHCRDPLPWPHGKALVAGVPTLAAGRAASVIRHRPGRSEEHTSELQSLMRISYAVFCLKKKNETTQLYKQQTERATAKQ